MPRDLSGNRWGDKEVSKMILSDRWWEETNRRDTEVIGLVGASVGLSK